MENDRLNSYRNFLIEVSTVISEEDLARMKFKCDSVIKKRQSEKIKSSLELFTALEERGYLSETNVSYLKDLLKSCCGGKVDGIRILESYERCYTPGYIPPGHPGPGLAGVTNLPGHVPFFPAGSGQPNVVYVVQNTPTQSGLNHSYASRPKYEGPDLSSEINFLCRNLGKEWRFFVRALNVSENEIEAISCDYTSVRERIHQCLLSWQCQEQQKANKQSLICALQSPSVARNDLASSLSSGMF
ncbi:hypothetical protein ACF0H5_000734 [Mactra antiquata]